MSKLVSGKRRWLIAALIVAIACAFSAYTWAGDLGRMKLLVRLRFPRVHQITAAQLAGWLHDSHRAPPYLLDVRTPAEFAVSHLAGAHRVDPEANPADVLATLPRDRPVVTYCSVGYRSSAMAEGLLRAGYSNVSNLEGSIFQWANDGRPLLQDGQPAQVVHPYNARWGKMLKPERRANVPPVE